MADIASSECTLLSAQLECLFRAVATHGNDLERVCADLAPVFQTDEQTAELRRVSGADGPAQLTPRLVEMMCVGHVNLKYGHLVGYRIRLSSLPFASVIHMLYYVLDEKPTWDTIFWAVAASRRLNQGPEAAVQAVNLRTWAEDVANVERLRHAAKKSIASLIPEIVDLALEANPSAPYGRIRDMHVDQLMEEPLYMDAVVDMSRYNPATALTIQKRIERYLEAEAEWKKTGLPELEDPDPATICMLLLAARESLPTCLEVGPWLRLYTWLCNDHRKGKLPETWPRPEDFTPRVLADRQRLEWMSRTKMAHRCFALLPAAASPAPAAVASPTPCADASTRAMAQLLAEEEDAEARERAQRDKQQRKQQRRQEARAARQAAERAAQEARRAAEQQRAAEAARQLEQERARRHEAWRAEREAYDAALAQRAAQLAAQQAQQPQQQRQQQPHGEMECVMCMDEVPATRCQPCKHKVMCLECAMAWLSCNRECPYCAQTAFSFTVE